ncbi:MAG TPA: hypothetical protein VJ810_31815 [Blastocatellia bacterium]|nr:hypothetical protein [Blastocatellia bacterium]
MNLPQYLAWLNNPSFWLTALAGAVGAVWALTEIVGEFRAETGRALRSSGAWLLMIVNFIAAAMIFLLAVNLFPSARNWPSALFIGFAWPTVFRNVTLKLAQPLNESKNVEAAAFRLERAYANVQSLALQLINSVITRQRARLLDEALNSDLNELAKYARGMIAVSPRQMDKQAALIDQTLERKVDDDAKKAYLVALVMNEFSHSALDDFVSQRRKQRVKN